jgi:N-acetylmuramic acid 6-phosphate (MurNAc-6-P) etherase
VSVKGRLYRGVDKSLVQGFIAGGETAITCSIEGNKEKGASDTEKAKVTKIQSLVSPQADRCLMFLRS